MREREMMAGDGTSPMLLAPDDDNHSTKPLHYKQLLIGRRAGAYQYPSHAYEHLLIGWIMDAYGANAGEEGEEMASGRRIMRWCPSTHPPPL